MILHVSDLKQFIPPFIKFINAEFQSDHHQFWLPYSKEISHYPLEKADNIYLGKRTFLGQVQSYFFLSIMLQRANKVILHGLFNVRVIILLALCPWLLKKCYWVIWGGDLYQYQKPNSRLRDKVKERLRAFVIRRFGHLVTYIPGDVELARKWYAARGEYHESLMYLSNVVDPEMLNVIEQRSEVHQGLNILVGNSADPSNNHIESLRKLLPYKEENIRVHVPLSYGDQNHANKVISQGYKWFGDKFVPITDFMPFGHYLAFLKSQDIAIFNHQRQQAMGNTITLLGMGKTVFMRRDLSHWHFLSGLGIKLSDVADLTVRSLGSDEAHNNARIVSSYFSRAKLVEQLAEIFK